MLIRKFCDVIISLTNKNIYSIQLNLALIPQDDTLQKFSVIAHVLQPAVFRFISSFFAHAYERLRANFQRKLVPLD